MSTHAEKENTNRNPLGIEQALSLPAVGVGSLLAYLLFLSLGISLIILPFSLLTRLLRYIRSLK